MSREEDRRGKICGIQGGEQGRLLQVNWGRDWGIELLGNREKSKYFF